MLFILLIFHSEIQLLKKEYVKIYNLKINKERKKEYVKTFFNHLKYSGIFFNLVKFLITHSVSLLFIL